MGMAIVHSLVSMHGGKIDIATGEGGTLFDIELPRE
jgi:signal transduction histidine kinase